jgi:hypothetical protein
MPCNWGQAGLLVGYSCFAGTGDDQQHLFFEVMTNGNNQGNCPAVNGGGYLQLDYGVVAAGSSHTFIAYSCQLTGGCSYGPPCGGQGNFTSTYQRAAFKIDGCMRASNVYVDDPTNGQRWISATLEDFYGVTGLRSDYGSANFSNSTYQMAHFQQPTGMPAFCGSPAENVYAYSWVGCVLADQ